MLGERPDVRQALLAAAAAAIRDYLVNMAGQDLPDDQALLDEYRFDVEETNGGVLIRARHHTDIRWTLMFTVQVTDT